MIRFFVEILEHEQELALGRRDLAGERLLGAIEDALDDVAIVRAG